MNKKLQLLCVAILSAFMLKGQSTPTDDSKSRLSGTEVPSQQWNDWFNKEVEKFEKSLQNGGSTITYQIPVIFHVIHFGEPLGTFPNIDSNQIKTQFVILNNDYAGTGLNYTNVPQPFAGLIANTGISFCRAKKDPNGVALVERGIKRWNANTQGWTNPNTAGLDIVTYFNTVIKPNTIYDPTKYLNIWISDKPTTTSFFGFATFPAGTTLVGIPNSGGTALTDGVWCWAKTVGNINAVSAPHDKGRILTKEIGHWLGLRNIWGDGNCLDDFCSDTPWGKQANSGCPPYPSYVNRCGIAQSPYGEMTMNFMDETDDACRYMFTPQQAIRMQTAMSQCIYRNLLGTHNLCNTVTPTPAPAVANFYINGTPCVNQPFTPINTSTGGDPPTFQWSTAPTAVIYPSPQVASPAITFNSPGTYTIYLTAQNNLNIGSYSLVVSSVTTCPTQPLCLDTIRMIKSVDTLITYKATNNSQILGCQNGFAGFLTGTNCYGDKEFAQFYPASSYSAIPLPQVNSVIVLFDSIGTKATTGTLGTQITCFLYGGTATNGPNSQLASKSDSLGKIAASTKTASIKYVGWPSYTFAIKRIIPYKFDFATPVVLSPNTAGFFASIQTPFNSPLDSIRIFSNTKTNLSTDSSSWLLQNPTNNWRTLRYNRNAKVQLAIMPQITCRPVVGIQEIKTEFNSNITLMPNPSSGQFNLIFTLPKEQSLNIKAYNAIGEQISNEQLENVSHNLITMDLSGRPDGIYFIEISNGTERVVQKIIINH